jgi:hypothetical protein
MPYPPPSSGGSMTATRTSVGAPAEPLVECWWGQVDAAEAAFWRSSPNRRWYSSSSISPRA